MYELEFPSQPIIQAAEDAHSFLKSVYQNPAVPLSVRMRGATVAIEYERPSLKATAIVHAEGDFAQRLERAIARSQNGSRLPQVKTIEAQVAAPEPQEHSAHELKPRPTPSVARAFVPDAAIRRRRLK